MTRGVVAAMLFAASLRAQSPGARSALVTAAVSADTVGVGQPFVVRVRVQAPKNAVVRFPLLPDTTDAIEPIDPLILDDTPNDATLDRSASYRVAAWDIGARAPRLGPVVVTVGGASASYAVTVPAVFVLATLPADSTLHVARDARDPFPLPSGLWRLGVILAIVAALTYAYLRRRRDAAGAGPVEADAFVDASASFRALEALALSEAGEAGRHVIAHVDVLRAYLARRFPAAAASLTVPELNRVLAASELPVLPERVAALLDRDEDLRFAESSLSRSESVSLAAEARALVRDIETAHAERQRALERGPQRPARR